jgi:branched-chain amino acid transport system substrate-binding protein
MVARLSVTRAGLGRRAFLALAAGITLLPLVGCSITGGGGPSTADSGDAALTSGPQKPSVKVAFLLPLSGGNSQAVAKALKQAGELALFDFDNPNVELVPKDTRGTPEGAKQAAREAVKEGAELIIGPLFANEVTAAASEAQAGNVPMIAFSSDRKVAGNGVYLLSFLARRSSPRSTSSAARCSRSRPIRRMPTAWWRRSRKSPSSW